MPDRAALRAAVPKPEAGDVGGRADAHDEDRAVHPSAAEAGVSGQEEPEGQERCVGHGGRYEVHVVLAQHAVTSGRQAVRHELWDIMTQHCDG